jgi:hypothetical protein
MHDRPDLDTPINPRAVEDSITEGIGFLTHQNETVNYHRAYLHTVVNESSAAIVGALGVALDQLEANGNAAMKDLLASQRESRLLRVKLDAVNRTVRWLRTQITDKTTDAAQVAGGTQ